MARPHPTGALSELSMIRARNRAHTLILLSSLGEAYLGDLARGIGVDRRVIRWLMEGYGTKYSKALALIPLGLATETKVGQTRIYRITEKGRRKARSLTSRKGARRWRILG